MFPKQWTAFTLLIAAAAGSAMGQTRAALPTPSTFRQPSIFEAQRAAQQQQQPSRSPAANPSCRGPRHHPYDRPRVVMTGAGVTVEGHVGGNNAGISFHLGTDPCLVPDRSQHTKLIYRQPGLHAPSWVRYYSLRPWYDDRPSRIQGFYTEPSRLQSPAGVPARSEPAAEELTPKEHGIRHLGLGEAEESVKALTEHLKSEADDAEAMRLLAVALLLDSRTEEGVAMMMMAYQTSPELGRDAMTKESVPANDLRRALVRVSRFANTYDTGSAWFTLAVLMQTQERDAPAARMLRKAERAGFEPEVAQSLRRAVER